MKKYYIIIGLIITACSVNQDSAHITSKQAIPLNSDLIVKCHNLQSINDQTETFPWWNELQKTKNFQEKIIILNKLNTKYNLLKLFNDRIIYVSCILEKEQNNEIIFITPLNLSEEKEYLLTQELIKSLQQKSTINTKRYEGAIIYHLKEFDTFISIYKEVFLLSFSKITIEKSIRQINTRSNIFENEIVKKIEENSPKYSDLNILIKTDFLEKIIGQKNIFLNSKTWSSFDVKLTENYILLNGLTNRGSIKYLRDTKYSKTKTSNIEKILPRHIKGFYKYQINNDTDINEVINIISDAPHKNNYHLSYKKWKPTEINTAYTTATFSNLAYLIFKTNNTKESMKSLKKLHVNKDTNNDYLNYKIQEITTHKKEKKWINTIIQKWDKAYYIIIDDYIVLANSNKKIKSLINNSISHQTIGNSKALNIINKQLGNKSHTSFFLTFENHQQEWKKIFNSVSSKNIGSEKYFFNSLIFLYQNNFVKNTTQWSSNLEHETTYTPQIVKNHYNQEFEIVTQDIENNIYLIDDQGVKLWQKKIGKSIIGDIHQIDSYRNNKLQYLFNTKDSIYLIDRKGKHVPPFPIKTKKPMSMPLAVFDYDKTRNYRILIVMNNELSMYDQKGEIISGWEFVKSQSNISFKPEHYQLFNKDYIVISEENGTINLLNRRGQARANIKEKIYRSNQSTSLVTANSLQNSKLLIKNTSGNILGIYFNGKVDTIHNNKHDIYLQKQDSQNLKNNYTITIRSQELRFKSTNNQFKYKFTTNLLSEPIVFNYNDSIFIAIKNNMENLIYVLNEDGTLHQNPMFGTTNFSIINSYYTNQKNIIVGSQEGLIYNYKIN